MSKLQDLRLTEDFDFASVTYQRVKAAFCGDQGVNDIPADGRDLVLVACAQDSLENKRAITDEEADDMFGEEGSPEMDKVVNQWTRVALALDNIF